MKEEKTGCEKIMIRFVDEVETFALLDLIETNNLRIENHEDKMSIIIKNGTPLYCKLKKIL